MVSTEQEYSAHVLWLMKIYMYIFLCAYVRELWI